MVESRELTAAERTNQGVRDLIRYKQERKLFETREEMMKRLNIHRAVRRYFS
jgi:hypothetical protein